MNSLQGYVLVASPHLLDSNFLRSVVLIIQHNDQGAFGVVLNRPTNNTIAQLWGLVSQTPCDNPSPVYVGGPVPGPLVAIHGDAALSVCSSATRAGLPGNWMANCRRADG